MDECGFDWPKDPISYDDSCVDLICDTLKKIKECDVNAKILQIKQNCGALIIHVDSTKSEMCDILRDARNKSLSICQKHTK